MNEKGLENLRNAIIVQACKDYRSALAGHNVNGRTPESMVDECERFFRSDWFFDLTDLDPEIIISRIRKEFEP